MKIVFMGTSSFAVPALTKLIDSEHAVIGVITQPDRPRGRGKKMLCSPVKELALLNNLDVLQPEKVKAEEVIGTIKAWEPDLIVVASYGQILPQAILDLPRYGCLNIHSSLLPSYRGAAPIQSALMAGDKVTGVTIMFMNAGLDTGDIILQRSVEIDDDMDHGELERILSFVGADLMVETIKLLPTFSYTRISQNEANSSYAPMLTREDEKIYWNQEAAKIRNQIRALSPQPAAYTSLSGTRFKIFKCQIVSRDQIGVAGQVMEVSKDSFTVQTGLGLLEILEVQKEGKNRMACRDFLKGFTVIPGDILA